MDNLELNLLENAIDSLKHAIEHYNEDPIETRRYKYAIMHLSQGVTLLLKERLRREHPNFLFRKVETNIHKADIAVTVNVDEVLIRLENIAGLSLTRGKQVCKQLASLRNAIEHYELRIARNEADIIIGQTIPFVASFMHDELDTSLEHCIGQDNWDSLLSIQGFFQTAVDEAKRNLKDENLVSYHCERCDHETATPDFTSVHEDPFRLTIIPVICLVCRTTQSQQLVPCLRCGTKRVIERSDIAQFNSYCADCSLYASRKFGHIRIRGTSQAVYVAEVERWFEHNKSATVAELTRLVWNVSTAGSSSRDYAPSLYLEGVIDFEYDNEREEYEATRHLPGLWNLHDDHSFIWTFQESHPDSST